ncbi:MAG: hypothetical protein KDK76_01425 [Chlamydiia bacterium]|nr:hypothetical protein [Chlamydiia bacterium]
MAEATTTKNFISFPIQGNDLYREVQFNATLSALPRKAFSAPTLGGFSSSLSRAGSPLKQRPLSMNNIALYAKEITAEVLEKNGEKATPIPLENIVIHQKGKSTGEPIPLSLLRAPQPQVEALSKL